MWKDTHKAISLSTWAGNRDQQIMKPKSSVSCISHRIKPSWGHVSKAEIVSNTYQILRYSWYKKGRGRERSWGLSSSPPMDIAKNSGPPTKCVLPIPNTSNVQVSYHTLFWYRYLDISISIFLAKPFLTIGTHNYVSPSSLNSYFLVYIVHAL